MRGDRLRDTEAEVLKKVIEARLRNRGKYGHRMGAIVTWVFDLWFWRVTVRKVGDAMAGGTWWGKRHVTRDIKRYLEELVDKGELIGGDMLRQVLREAGARRLAEVRHEEEIWEVLWRAKEGITARMAEELRKKGRLEGRKLGE